MRCSCIISIMPSLTVLNVGITSVILLFFPHAGWYPDAIQWKGKCMNPGEAMHAAAAQLSDPSPLQAESVLLRGVNLLPPRKSFMNRCSNKRKTGIWRSFHVSCSWKAEVPNHIRWRSSNKRCCKGRRAQNQSYFSSRETSWFLQGLRGRCHAPCRSAGR